MMTSSNETFFALLALCVGNSLVIGVFPSQMPVTRSFDVSLIGAWTNGWANNREAGYLRRHRAHYDVIVMPVCLSCSQVCAAHLKMRHQSMTSTGARSWNGLQWLNLKVAHPEFSPSNGHQCPLLLIWFIFNPSMDKQSHSPKVWDEITYPFLNINGANVEEV